MYVRGPRAIGRACVRARGVRGTREERKRDMHGHGQAENRGPLSLASAILLLRDGTLEHSHAVGARRG
jgi:hypothetical protein